MGDVNIGMIGLLVVSIHVIGDWGRRGQFSQIDVARRMNQLSHDAVISVGDNFYPEGLSDANDPQIKESWSGIYHPKTPWFVSLGNHDHRGNVTAQMNINDSNWIMPDNVYSFDVGQHTFVVADSQTMDENQVRRLDNMLSSGNQYKWLVAHHPIASAGYHHHVNQKYRDWMVHLCHKHNVTAILSGHDHTMQYIEWQGIRQIISGTGSSSYFVQHPQEGLIYFATHPGFVNLNLQKNKISFWDTEKETFSTLF